MLGLAAVRELGEHNEWLGGLNRSSPTTSVKIYNIHIWDSFWSLCYRYFQPQKSTEISDPTARHYAESRGMLGGINNPRNRLSINTS